MRRFVATALLAPCLLAPAFGTGAFADDLNMPARKAGQWEIAMSLGKGRPGMTVEICLDATTDKAMMDAGLSLSRDMCPSQSVTREGENIVIDSTCNLGPMTTTSHIVISGDFQSRYVIDISSDIEGAPAGMPSKSQITQTATWVSESCKDGLRPGEMLMPGGIKFDATKLMQSMGG